MRSALLALLVVSVFLPTACAGGEGTLRPAAQNRLDARQATAEMEKIYNRILLKFSDDALFVAKMRAAQAAWRRFRDAHVESLFPAEDKALVYGSVYSRCRQEAVLALTLQRTEQLRPWLDGVAEGDVCAGSRPLR